MLACVVGDALDELALARRADEALSALEMVIQRSDGDPRTPRDVGESKARLAPFIEYPRHHGQGALDGLCATSARATRRHRIVKLRGHIFYTSQKGLVAHVPHGCGHLFVPE